MTSRRVILALSLTAVFFILMVQVPVIHAERSIHVVTVFPSLVEDIRQLLCSGDTVDYLVPPGVDPHEYQLTTSDLDKLAGADIVVSTGHTGVEVKIEELAASGELKAIVVNIMEIPGLRITVNPSTGQANMHMPIYDPLNYMLFVENLTAVIAGINPSKADCYREKALEVISTVTQLAADNYRRYLGVPAVVDSPGVQYAVEWMGFKVLRSLQPEHEVEPQPTDLKTVEDLMRSGSVKIAFVSSPVTGTPGRMLVEMAERYRVPVVEVPSPLTLNSTIVKLKLVASRVEEAGIKPETAQEACSVSVDYRREQEVQYALIAAYTIIGFTLGVLASRWASRRGLKK